jgi:lipopolysaccharide export system permease protein
LTSIIVSEFVVPRYSVRMHYIQDVLIEGQSADQLSEGARWIRDGKRLINFRDYNPITETLTSVKIVTLGENFKPASIVEARKGQFVADQKNWYLNDVTRAEFRPNGDLGETKREKDLTLKFPMEPGMLQKERRTPGEMSMRELTTVIRHGRKTGAGTLEFLVDLHGKIAYPFAALIVSLLGLKFGYRSERSTETVVGVLIAFGIGISYWFVFSWTTALGKRGDFPPLISAWAANIVISLVIFGDYLRSRAAAK